MRFKSLRISEEESIEEYFLRVDEVTNMIRGLGEAIKEDVIIQKVLRSLPIRFNSKISAIEEMNDLKSLIMDQLLGTLIAYDMIVGKENIEPQEAAFKVSKKGKNHRDHQEYSNCESTQ